MVPRKAAEARQRCPELTTQQAEILALVFHAPMIKVGTNHVSLNETLLKLEKWMIKLQKRLAELEAMAVIVPTQTAYD
jgi:hypothetical protein